MLYDGAFDEARVRMVKNGEDEEQEEEEDVKERDDQEKEMCKLEEGVENAVSVTTWQALDFNDLLNQETCQDGIEELDMGNGSSEERSTSIGIEEETQCPNLCEEQKVACDDKFRLEQCDLEDEDKEGDGVDEELEDVKDDAVGKEAERGQLLQDTATQVH